MESTSFSNPQPTAPSDRLPEIASYRRVSPRVSIWPLRVSRGRRERCSLIGCAMCSCIALKGPVSRRWTCTSSPNSSAFRCLLMNTLEPLLRGDKLAQEQLTVLFRQVQTTKAAKAQELLAKRSQNKEK